MNKKLIISLSVIGVVAAIAIGGTVAYFSDTETSTGNTFTAGTLDLKVDDKDYPEVITVNIPDMKPGDTIHQYWVLKNVGSVCGQPSVEFDNIVNYENDCTEPERDIDSTCGNPGEGEGELGKKPYVLMKWRQGTDPWHEILMVANGHTKLDYLSGPYGLGENDGASIPVLCKDDEVEIEFRPWWDGRHSTPQDNEAQSDSVEFDVIFHLDQVTP